MQQAYQRAGCGGKLESLTEAGKDVDSNRGRRGEYAALRIGGCISETT